MRTLTPTRNPQNNPPVVQSVVACSPWNWDWVPPNVISGLQSFAQWFADRPDFNVEVAVAIPLVDGAFSNPSFFPLDGFGYGNTPGWPHNYHFTFEHHSSFEYTPGTEQRVTFAGNDDMWIFINGQLALDLGGVKEAMTGSIHLDAQAGSLGLTAGVASFDLFYAQRQTPESVFELTTNIECFTPVP